jgi:SNF2 family DNA or RNA helicase
VLRPLGGTDDEVTGIYLPLETVAPAQFELPEPTVRNIGDYQSGRLLRDAIRLGARANAGPFRSFARLAVEPRPYQLVPLLMALRMNPVRLLIADDVGIGKTIEACLIARELIDRGEVKRLAVLCPPPLAEQWQTELREKFHLDAELVLPGTATRLERTCRLGESLFERYPYVVVSTDFIKAERRRSEFLRTCPEMVIVDEAHTCAWSGETRSSGRHQRHQLLSGLAANPNRHLVLVSATPHSGNEDAFRSLLKILEPELALLPNDLTGSQNDQNRRKLAKYFVQRRRGDIRHFMQEETPFPKRLEREETYQLSPEYRRFVEKVIEHLRETVLNASTGKRQQRVRWWSALALLRSIASSPAAAAETLRTRAANAMAESVEEADDIGRRAVLDQTEDEGFEGMDITPGSDIGEEDDSGKSRSWLRSLAREAELLKGAKDVKLQRAIALVLELLKDGFSPIVFCRFIPTAEYVAAELRRRLPANVEVTAITGLLPPAEREERINALDDGKLQVMVCTDCLSEGINLQRQFNAVMHYDLAWNPTRHEQREGRVDRYGQSKPEVRALTYYGIDNHIDGLIIDILIQKHKTIRKRLEISVPVPTADAEQVLEAIFSGLLMKEQVKGGDQFSLFGDLFLDSDTGRKETLHQEWEEAAAREERSRSVFAQQTIKVDEVAREMREVQASIGSHTDVRRWAVEAAQAHNAVVSLNGVAHFDFSESPRAVKEIVLPHSNNKPRFTARFELPVKPGEIYLNRAHPIVESLASYVVDTALDGRGEGVARRCGVIQTSAVMTRTTVLLMRFRYHIVTRRGDEENQLLAEDNQLMAFAGSPHNARWLDVSEATSLLQAQSERNIDPDRKEHFLRLVTDAFDLLRPHLDEAARERGQHILEAHRRVRSAAGMRGVTYHVEPHLPPDVMGIFIYLPLAPAAVTSSPLIP